MKRYIHLILALICCALCAFSFLICLVWFDAQTTIIAYPLAVLTATSGFAAWCRWYTIKSNPPRQVKAKVLEMKKQIQALPKTKPSKRLHILRTKIQDLLNTPFAGKTSKQKYQRQGMDEALKDILELIEELENK